MKKQASFKEYTITIADSGSIEVYKIFKNALSGLQEVAASINFSYPPSWFAQKLGTALLAALNDGDKEATSAISGEYLITREEKGNIKVSKLFDNSTGALREISSLIGFNAETGWNTRQFGSKLVDAINSGLGK